MAQRFFPFGTLREKNKSTASEIRSPWYGISKYLKEESTAIALTISWLKCLLMTLSLRANHELFKSKESRTGLPAYSSLCSLRLTNRHTEGLNKCSLSERIPLG